MFRHLLLGAVFALAVSTVAFSEEKGEAVNDQLKKLEGLWKGTVRSSWTGAETSSRVELSIEVNVDPETISEQRRRFLPLPRQRGRTVHLLKERWDGEECPFGVPTTVFTIDPSANPKTVSLLRYKGTIGSIKRNGIFELKDGRLRIAVCSDPYVGNDHEPPRSFDVSAELRRGHCVTVYECERDGRKK